MNKKIVGGGVTAILLLLLGAWWMGWLTEQEDPLITQMREIAAAPPEQRDDPAVREQFRERIQGMNDEQRAAMFEQMAPIFIPLMMTRFTAEYDKFMAMSPEERNRELDKRIDEMQARGGPGGGGGGGPGGGPGRANMDPKKMAEFQKKMLGWTTPEQRSKMQNGMQMFTDRMKQRGMDPPPMPGGGFF
jgi:hypothetical protein